MELFAKGFGEELQVCHFFHFWIYVLTQVQISVSAILAAYMFFTLILSCCQTTIDGKDEWGGFGEF